MAAQGPDREADETMFLAPYGNPDNPALAPRVRVTCATEGLRSDVRRGSLPARCLGKVEDWNAEDGVLEVRAIAIVLLIGTDPGRSSCDRHGPGPGGGRLTDGASVRPG
jgi:hypothetical protein